MTTQATPLTRKQLEQLTEEYQSLEDWMTVRDFCNQVYGPGKVASLEVETYGEYNDEGGTDYSVSSVTAKDAQGEDVEFDLTLPFWTQPYFVEIFRGKTDVEDAMEAALDALKDYDPWRKEDKDLAEQHGWVIFSNLPCDVHEGGDETYNLTQEPTISFPVVVAVQ